MYAVYETATGNLYSTANDLTSVADPLPPQFSMKQVATPPDGYVWSTTLLDFVAPPPPRIVEKSVFIQRFTTTERIALFGYNIGTTYTTTQLRNITAFVRYLDFLERIPLDDAAIQSGVNYLETVSIIAAGRAAVILA